MGKRGPRPTPQATLAARGSRLAKSRPGEPEVDVGIPKKPDWLFGPVASAKWDEIVPRLIEQGIMSDAYGDFLAMYCVAFQDLSDAMEMIRQEGMTCTSEKGGSYQHPAVSIKQGAIATISKFGAHFGMSPSAVRDVVQNQGANKKKSLSSVARKR